MVRPSRPPRGIRGRINSREGAKFVGKVRLVIEPAIERQFRPSHVAARVQLLHRALKSLHPAPRLRRKANRLAKHLREPALAPARLLRHLPHRRHPRRAVKPPHRKRNLTSPPLSTLCKLHGKTLVSEIAPENSAACAHRQSPAADRAMNALSRPTHPQAARCDC